jgi:hypothetical protein
LDCVAQPDSIAMAVAARIKRREFNMKAAPDFCFVQHNLLRAANAQARATMCAVRA